MQAHYSSGRCAGRQFEEIPLPILLAFPVNNNNNHVQVFGVQIREACRNVNDVRVGRFYRGSFIQDQHLSLFTNMTWVHSSDLCVLTIKYVVYSVLLIVRVTYAIAIYLLAMAAGLGAIGMYFVIWVGVICCIFYLPIFLSCSICLLGWGCCCDLLSCFCVCPSSLMGLSYLVLGTIEYINRFFGHLCGGVAYFLFAGSIIMLTLSYAVIMFVPTSLYILFLYLNKSRISTNARFNNAALVAEFKISILFPLYDCFASGLLYCGDDQDIYGLWGLNFGLWR